MGMVVVDRRLSCGGGNRPGVVTVGGDYVGRQVFGRYLAVGDAREGLAVAPSWRRLWLANETSLYSRLHVFLCIHRFLLQQLGEQNPLAVPATRCNRQGIADTLFAGPERCSAHVRCSMA